MTKKRVALILAVVALILAAATWTTLQAQRGWSGGVIVVTSEKAVFSPLAFGEEVVLVSCGPLTYRAVCESTGTTDRIRVFADSSQDGWFEEDGGGPRRAGDAYLVFEEITTTGGVRYDNDIDEGSSLGPGGYHLSIDGETLGLGVNVLGRDCIVAGTATCIQALGF